MKSKQYMCVSNSDFAEATYFSENVIDYFKGHRLQETFDRQQTAAQLFNHHTVLSVHTAQHSYMPSLLLLYEGVYLYRRGTLWILLILLFGLVGMSQLSSLDPTFS